MPTKEQEVQPIDASLDDVVESMVKHPLGTTNISNKNKRIDVFSNSIGTIPTQGDLFHVDKQIEFDGIEMGVLENGMPYLTSRGLARMCGIDHAPFHRLTTNWEEERIKPRGKAINDLLKSANYNENTLFFRAEHNGRPINAFPEPVCLALLEY
jgi:hypothetical protein